MNNNETVKEVDKREKIRVVTKNEFITAEGLSELSIQARKLLYLATAQCKETDKEFYEYRISVPDFAEMMGIDSSNVYRTADSVTDELMKSFLKIKKSEKHFKKYTLFSKCEYEEDGELYFKLNKDMTDFLLEIKGNFTQPLLSDFMKMRSPYSMAIWHLIQKEMKSKKPGARGIEFYLSLEELRGVTGTENKLKQVGQFKERVLDKALREIKDNCATKITYTNKKKGKTIIGFDFIAINKYGINITEWEKENPQKAEKIDKEIRKKQLEKLSEKRPLSATEKDEYDSLVFELNQMTIDDYAEKEPI